MDKGVMSRAGRHVAQNPSQPKVLMTPLPPSRQALQPKFRQSPNKSKPWKHPQKRRRQRHVVAVRHGRNQHRQNPLNPLKPTTALTLLS
jgi:hypothetical protein